MSTIIEQFSNNASSTLNGGINASVTSLTVQSADAAKFPASGNFRLIIDNEIIIVGAVSGSVFSNLSRGAENTTAATHSNGATVTHVVTAGSIHVNPRGMTTPGDLEYLNSSGVPTRFAVPADGVYHVTFTSGVPTWTAATVSGSVPSGCVIPFAGSAAPSGFLFCDGSAVSRSTYANLFAAIGVTFGAGDGSTTFNLPDMRQRFPLGKAASGTGSTLGATGGLIDHTHTYNQVINHTHVVNITDPGHSHSGIPGNSASGTNGSDFIAALQSGYVATGTSTTGISATTNNPSGGVATGTTASNNPPFLVLNYIIAQ